MQQNSLEGSGNRATYEIPHLSLNRRPPLDTILVHKNSLLIIIICLAFIWILSSVITDAIDYFDGTIYPAKLISDACILQTNKQNVWFFLFCTMTNKCTILSEIITLLHVSTLSYHPQGTCNQYLAKLHKYFKRSCLLIHFTITMFHRGFIQVLIL
jgi:hypothetical protein